jgi:plasmid stability protein
MGQILVRKLDDSVLAKLKARAKANKRSAEAEVRDILSQALKPKQHQRLPLSALAGSGRSGRSQAEVDDYVRKLREEWDR